MSRWPTKERTEVICLRKRCQYHRKSGCSLEKIVIGEHSGLCVNFNSK